MCTVDCQALNTGLEPHFFLQESGWFLIPCPSLTCSPAAETCHEPLPRWDYIHFWGLECWRERGNLTSTCIVYDVWHCFISLLIPDWKDVCIHVEEKGRDQPRYFLKERILCFRSISSADSDETHGLFFGLVVSRVRCSASILFLKPALIYLVS